MSQGFGIAATARAGGKCERRERKRGKSETRVTGVAKSVPESDRMVNVEVFVL